MLNAKQIASYRSVSVDTASPGRLILMLFDGALRFIHAAEEGFKSECPRTRQEVVHNNLIRAQDILHELQRSLNFRDGGEFSTNLWRVYDFMGVKLMEANLRKEPDGLAVVTRLLREIRDAWEQMLREQGAGVEQGARVALSA